MASRPMSRRVLDPEPVSSLGSMDPARVLQAVEASGLRGRGGAGFPTAVKWRAVLEHRSPTLPATVVVNAAEGEPGSFKDRAILRANAARVLEGARLAATAVGADRIVVALKRSFTTEAECVRDAARHLAANGWPADGPALDVFTGPTEYLYGEETALLEALDGRPPFPRLAPPYRHGVEEVGFDVSEPAGVQMASGPTETVAPPTLVNNVETLANIPGIVAEGPDWFRSVGTDASPGTLVCSVTGAVRGEGVGEFPMGTSLGAIIDDLGGGARPGQRLVGVLPGVSGSMIPADLLDTPATYEDLERIGSSLGAGTFLVLDDSVDPVAVAHGAAWFLAVESCGQCEPCKADGLAIAEILDRLQRSEASELDLVALGERLETVTDGARCFLAHQQQRVVTSLMDRFPEAFRAHATNTVPAAEQVTIAPVADLRGDTAVLDPDQSRKQPDWTYDEVDSGKWPAARLES